MKTTINNAKFLLKKEFSGNWHFGIEETVTVGGNCVSSNNEDTVVSVPAPQVGDTIIVETVCNQWRLTVAAVAPAEGGWEIVAERAEYDGAYRGFGQRWESLTPLFSPSDDLRIESTTGAKTYGELKALHEYREAHPKDGVYVSLPDNKKEMRKFLRTFKRAQKKARAQ